MISLWQSSAGEAIIYIVRKAYSEEFSEKQE